MANVLSVLPNGVRVSEREKLVRYKLTLSGAYVQAVRGQNVGEVLDLTKALNPTFQPEALWGPKGPDQVYVVNVGSTGYAISIIPGADANHWLLCIFSNVATQLAAGNYAANAAGLLNDVDIVIEASGRSFD